MKPLKTRDDVMIYVGKSKLRGIIIGQYENEVFPDVYWVEIVDGSLVDAHRKQLRKIKPNRTFYLARFETTGLSPEGFSFPQLSLEAIKKIGARHTINEIIEVREVKRHKLEDIPPIPDFLKKEDLTK